MLMAHLLNQVVERGSRWREALDERVLRLKAKPRHLLAELKKVVIPWWQWPADSCQGFQIRTGNGQNPLPLTPGLRSPRFSSTPCLLSPSSSTQRPILGVGHSRCAHLLVMIHFLLDELAPNVVRRGCNRRMAIDKRSSPWQHTTPLSSASNGRRQNSIS